MEAGRLSSTSPYIVADQGAAGAGAVSMQEPERQQGDSDQRGGVKDPAG